MPLAVSPGRRFLYAGLRAEPYPLASYAIDAATGALRLLGSARLADGMCYLAVDATGRALFAPPTAGRNSR
jgi:6-phosphogluconolactonase